MAEDNKQSVRQERKNRASNPFNVIREEQLKEAKKFPLDLGQYSSSVRDDIRDQVLGEEGRFVSKDPTKKRGQNKPAAYISSRGTSNLQKQAKSKEALMSSFHALAPAMFSGNEYDTYDGLDFLAVHIIQILREGIIEFAQMRQFEQDIFFRYAYRTNPVVGRIVDLHTDLPLSKIKLQAPKDTPEIVRDFILDFYGKIFKHVDFDEILREAVQTYNIHGYVDIMVDDDFMDSDHVLQSFTDMDIEPKRYTEADAKKIAEVENKYREDPSSVTLDERMEYLELKFPMGFSKEYRGPNRLRILPFWEVLDRYKNEDISYEAVEVAHSESYLELRKEGKDDMFLREMGYSKGFLSLMGQEGGNSPNPEQISYTLENDVYQGLPWLMKMESPDGSSPLKRIWHEILEWDVAKIAMRGKFNRLGKAGRVITAPEASSDQIVNLEAQVEEMLNDPNYAIVTNFGVDWSEVDIFVKQELAELSDRLPAIIEEMSMGMGMPSSLITGDSQYSGDTIKLDMLNTFYQSFVIYILDIIEVYFIRPIAMRKGLMILDEWGSAKLLYPKLTFSRIGIRSTEVYDLLFTLYQKGSVPVSLILDILNLDVDDVRRAVEKDLFTVNDPNFNEALKGMYGRVADDLYEQTDVLNRVIESIPVKKLNLKPAGPAPGEGGFGGPGAGGGGIGPTPGGGLEGGPGGGGGEAPGNNLAPGEVEEFEFDGVPGEGEEPSPGAPGEGGEGAPGEPVTEEGLGGEGGETPEPATPEPETPADQPEEP